MTWREAGASENMSQALTTSGWGATQTAIVGLRTHAHYEVRVRAFNAVGAGPPCSPLTATTLEGGKLIITEINYSAFGEKYAAAG